VDDGFSAFESLSDDGLRDIFRVEFIAPNGEPESGVDGGGLFKEFMVHICRTMFDPDFGLFSATTGDHTLYPAVGAFRTHRPRTAELYCFLGKVVGKAIYEMFLLEPQFCRVFLNRLLGRINEVDDVAALDRELHRNMLRIKEADNVEDLHVFFSITISDQGEVEEIDLIENGRNVPVTKDNLTRYFHLMANYKTNVQFQRHTAAFLQGVQCVVPRAWLKMFDPYELNLLISGSNTGFDVVDLRRNTIYSGGFQDDSPVVQWLWQLLQHMEPDDMGRFLMFATSCSRAPLLGFQNLYPKFCIHRVPDGERLPTASTCANLLKLPDYLNPEALKSKLMQAIRAEAGFDLS
jgi:ubiquitin-protein ligase E3 C